LKPSRLRRGEWLVGAGSLVLLASMVVIPSFRPTHQAALVDGWRGLSHARWLIVVTIAAGLALVLLQAARRGPALPVTFSLLVMLLGGVSVLWLIYRVLVSPPAGSRDVGGIVALVSACAITFGGWASLRQEGIAPEDQPHEIPTVDPMTPGGS
jgi:hypothetical protein